MTMPNLVLVALIWLIVFATYCFCELQLSKQRNKKAVKQAYERGRTDGMFLSASKITRLEAACRAHESTIYKLSQQLRTIR
jgi:hypothetical protein